MVSISYMMKLPRWRKEPKPKIAFVGWRKTTNQESSKAPHHDFVVSTCLEKKTFFTSVISNHDASMFTRGDSSSPDVHTSTSGLAPKGLGSGSPGERAGGKSRFAAIGHGVSCVAGATLDLDADVHCSCLSTIAAAPLPNTETYQQATKEAWTLGSSLRPENIDPSQVRLLLLVLELD